MILTVTFNPAVDHTVHVDGALSGDGVVDRASDARYDAGGKGINVSKYLVELDTETLATGLVGGFLGDYVRERLAVANIPHDLVDIDGLTRLNTTVLADEEYKINQSGPRVGPSAVDAVAETIEHYDPDRVVVAGSLPPGLDVSAIDAVSRAGDWETVVDLGGGTLADLHAHYAMCKPNREELAEATGLPVESFEECVAATEALREQGFETVVASLGADGALLADGDDVFHAPSRDVDVVDTVGAGDALLSGVLASQARGAAPRRALSDGVAVAARVVSVSGTRVPSFSGFPTDADPVAVAVR
ncbi:1-phosphofructokinase [Haloarchaeobius sp. HRN-SO-5]|uniref:1-phosphofructokinase n=1 Tax=Haloarchaeobius sp. HRN-SO-5 TaxID=3446118 RepID=UPI003EBFB6E9